MLYSGPPRERVSAIDLDHTHRPHFTHNRSERSAIILNATRIDDTAIGQMLFRPGKDIYKVLSSIYGPDGGTYADRVNEEFSHLFASNAQGQSLLQSAGLRVTGFSIR